MNFGQFTGNGYLEKFSAAMAWLRAHPNSELYIEPGIYTITGERERSFFRDMIAGKYGENPQNHMFRPDFEYTRILDFFGQEGTCVYAEGVTLLLDGFFEPISIRHCKNITVRGLTIDYLRKPYSRGEIVSRKEIGEGKEELVVRFCQEMPDSFCSPRVAVYNNDTGLFSFEPFWVEEKKRVSGNTFRILVSNAREKYDRGELYVWHSFHSRPAVCIQNAENVSLKNVTVHSHAGMGVVGHLSKDIFIEGLSVVPSAGERMSTNTDATHFASCFGKLVMRNCVFEGQGDDAVNVHNYYHAVMPLGGKRYRLICLASDGTHTQAVDLPFVGNRLQLSLRGTLDVAGEYTVLESVENADGTCEVELDKELPAETEKYYVCNISACPDFVFSHCRARNHLARSVLIKTQRALVENCVFEHTDLSAVVVAAEENWGEGASSERVEIRNNFFVGCSVRGDGASAVSVYTGSKERTGKQHGKIIVKNNVIACPDGRCGISVLNANEAEIENNLISTDAEPIRTDGTL